MLSATSPVDGFGYPCDVLGKNFVVKNGPTIQVTINSTTAICRFIACQVFCWSDENIDALIIWYPRGNPVEIRHMTSTCFGCCPAG